MRELLVNPNEANPTEETDCDYYILIDQIELAGGFACESYGVKIRSKHSGEEAAVPNLTASISRIDELIELLMRNTVTPVTLQDVVEDWI